MVKNGKWFCTFDTVLIQFGGEGNIASRGIISSVIGENIVNVAHAVRDFSLGFWRLVLLFGPEASGVYSTEVELATRNVAGHR